MNEKDLMFCGIWLNIKMYELLCVDCQIFFQKSARIKFNNPLLYFILKQYSLGSMLIRE